jgi:o-succinylbenzoate synthase
MKATYFKHTLQFKQASGTSRGILTHKDTWFILLEEKSLKGIGECGMFKGLSIDDCDGFELKLKWACLNIDLGLEVLLSQLVAFPSIQFGLEIAFRSFNQNSLFELFPSNFTSGHDSISINGLIWMGEFSFMKKQIKDKLKAGFSCIKLKIGALDFDKELALLKSIRDEFDPQTIEIRVDANGAFSPKEALEKLKQLSDFNLHSIEQPIKQGQLDHMAQLCSNSPIPIALDEELIGIFSVTNKQFLLQTIKPQFIILKPTLVGGFKGSQEWIDVAEFNKISWWVTSALESNIGLNAIAQWTYTLNNTLPQGLGTGGLFNNNVQSPLVVSSGRLFYDLKTKWNLKF